MNSIEIRKSIVSKIDDIKDKKDLLALKKIIQDFNRQYSKYISINQVR